jgi:hypothetical protein
MDYFKTLVGSITIATAGLTTCNNTGGAVDPAVQPVPCPDASMPLEATGNVSGSTLTVEVVYVADRRLEWAGTPTVSNVTGGTLVSVSIAPSSPHTVNVTIQLAGTPANGSFTLTGSVGSSFQCAVSQTLTFSVGDAGGVVVSSLEDTLPLRSREPATIVVVNRNVGAVELRPTGAEVGARVTWTATAGNVAVKADGGATWELPREPGLYQIELLVERGDDGLALDTLTLEVT